jgi:hypothetical protein
MDLPLTLFTDKKNPACRKCQAELHRVPRSFIMKIFFFWLPLKNYFCYKCLRKQWLIGS